MGKTRGKISAPGRPGTISYKNDAGQKIDIEFDQAFGTELGLVNDAKVSFNIVSIQGKDIAMAVNNVNKGTVTFIDEIKGTGTVQDSFTAIIYPFQQKYLAESQIAVGTAVQYVLVNSNNVLYAACLEL